MELERAGIPTAHICNLTAVASTVGSKRILAASSIVHPMGKPDLSEEKELEFRIQLAEEALGLLLQKPT
jgi:betaine reductase